MKSLQFEVLKLTTARGNLQAPTKFMQGPHPLHSPLPKEQHVQRIQLLSLSSVALIYERYRILPMPNLAYAEFGPSLIKPVLKQMYDLLPLFNNKMR